jgi:SAM-dependent methyltransferase
MEAKAHWEQVYHNKAATEVSWFQQRAAMSLKLIHDAEVDSSASIVDVGGGASTLVDDLLGLGYQRLTVLDLSGAALATTQARLGTRAAAVQWIEANVLEAELPAHRYELWHDRAVFHFLTAPSERAAYVSKLLKALMPGGLLLVATFAEDGPSVCSGLPVMRYNAHALHTEFGKSFELLRYEHEAHRTPNGKHQQFVYCLCRRLIE